MKIEKKNINVFLMLWIKNDPDLWSELRDIQIRLLLERIVKEMSFEQMAELHKTTKMRMILIFEAILIRIEHFISKEAAKYLRIINEQLDECSNNPFQEFDIHLN